MCEFQSHYLCSVALETIHIVAPQVALGSFPVGNFLWMATVRSDIRTMAVKSKEKRIPFEEQAINVQGECTQPVVIILMVSKYIHHYQCHLSKINR